MKCPLKFTIPLFDKEGNKEDNCEGAACSWWNAEISKCAMATFWTLNIKGERENDNRIKGINS